MKIVFLGSFYGRYLASFYEKHPAFPDMSYLEQQQLLLNDYFGELGSYIKWARKLGHVAAPIIYNCEPLQRRWAAENGVAFTDNWLTAIPIEQVKRLTPDVFFLDSIFNLYGEFLDEIKQYAGKTMGWIACPLPDDVPLKQMDLILSSHSGYVESFRRMGINSELLLPAFDPDILERITDVIEQDVDVSFIGGISPEHKKRFEFLERVAQKASQGLGIRNLEPAGQI